MLRLRDFREEEIELLLGWIDSADALFQWSGPWDFSWPLDARQLQRDLRVASERRRIFAAVERDSDWAAGHVMLSLRPEHGLGLIGRVLIDPERRGRGLGTAMMRETVRIGFEELGLHRLQLVVYDFNAAAIECYESVGFTVEGRLRDSTRGSAGYWTGYLMALLEDEYRARGEPHRGVRSARIGDAGTLAELATQLGYPQDEAAAREAIAKWAGDPAGEVLVAVEDGRVLGFVAVHAVPYFTRREPSARILALAVDRRERRGGIGRRLVAAAEAWALERGCADIELTSRRTRDDAHAFYRNLGYEDQCAGAAWFKRSLAGTAARPEPRRRSPRARPG